MKLNIKNIEIKDRTRRDFGNLSSLSESIEKYGLIQPLVVEKISDSNWRLIAGERRLRAALGTGILEVDCIERTDLSSQDRIELELEENLNRKDFEWTEEVEIKRRIDELAKERMGQAMPGSKKGEGWSVQKMAEKLDQSKGMVSQDLKLARYLKKNPGKVKEFQKIPKTVALRKIKDEEHADRVKSKLSSGAFKITEDLICCNAVEGLAAQEQNSVDLILTDPPYGTDVVSEGANHHGMMLDSDNLTGAGARVLLENLSEQIARILKPGRHFYIFHALEHYSFLKRILQINGLVVTSYPIIWSKGSPQVGGTGLSYMRCWEPIMFGYKPAEAASDIRELKDNCIDLLDGADRIEFKPEKSGKRLHAFEKPQGLLRFLIRQSSRIGELVLDPFSGSASTLLAAYGENRRAKGFELNNDHYVRALDRLQEFIT